ncbi:type II toxin-antitoxin system RelE/ParE family toxin [Parasediminibacterium sp. JCM 36343]|uniref:type II toxin-antitoxin system RelE/ParE family toxin n=1 Tax=Parasediminibacterium sp. JCM 36343 TaxID=3374279 RepID=UPI00397B344D
MGRGTRKGGKSFERSKGKIMYHLLFHHDAENEYQESYIWYELRQNGLGARFKTNVEAILNQLRANPQYFGYYKKPFREASVSDFPFTIVFTINAKQNIVLITAIYHAKRNPKFKFRK